MKQILTVVFGMVIFAGVSSCKQLQHPFAGQKILAESGARILYEGDVASIFTSDMNSEDSARVLKGYVDHWVRTQLKRRESERIFQRAQEDIDRQVEEYRSQLMNRKLDQYYLDQELDTLFTKAQVQAYYQKNKAEFILDKTIVKARVVKFPAKYVQSAKLKDLMISSGEKDYQDFVELCAKNGFELSEFNQWTEMPAVLELLPVSKDGNFDFLLSERKVHEFSEDNSAYFIRVLDSRMPGDYVPLENVAEVIKRVIYNQRKQDIIRYHDDSLYREALRNKEIVIHVK